MSKRELLVSALVTIMSTIKKENEFNTDIGSNCFEWYEKPLDAEQYPAIIIRDTDSDNIPASGSFNHILEIEIDIATKGKKPMPQMREAISDVLRAFGMFRNEQNYICAYKGSKSLIDQKDFTYGGTRMVFTINYSTSEWEH